MTTESTIAEPRTANPSASAANLTVKRIGSPWWTGFVATVKNQVKSFYREPAALAFTLGQPILLLLILNAFNFKVDLPNGQTRPYLDRLLPGMMAFTGMTVGLNSVAFALSRDKQRAVLRRVRTTPIPTGSFVAGIIVSRLLVALALTIVTYVAGVYMFGATVDGNVAGLIGLTMVGSLVFISLGILMVAISKSEDDIPPMFILILMPSLLFSGAFLDRGGLPDWLHWVTGGLPLTFLTHSVQQVANLNGGFADVQTDLIGLAVWGVAGFILCAWRFRLA